MCFRAFTQIHGGFCIPWVQGGNSPLKSTTGQWIIHLKFGIVRTKTTWLPSFKFMTNSYLSQTNTYTLDMEPKLKIPNYTCILVCIYSYTFNIIFFKNAVFMMSDDHLIPYILWFISAHLCTTYSDPGIHNK